MITLVLELKFSKYKQIRKPLLFKVRPQVKDQRLMNQPQLIEAWIPASFLMPITLYVVCYPKSEVWRDFKKL